MNKKLVFGFMVLMFGMTVFGCNKTSQNGNEVSGNVNRVAPTEGFVAVEAQNPQVTSLKGKYNLDNDEGYVESIEFVDDTSVRLIIEYAGRRRGKYEIHGTELLIITDEYEFPFEIKDGGKILISLDDSGLMDDAIFF
jgi:hypothetical protein